MADNPERLYTPVEATPTTLETARFWVQTELRKISNAFLRADEKYSNGGTGPAPSDPRDTVAYIRDNQTINGFGIDSLTSITGGWRVNFTNPATDVFSQSVQVQSNNRNSGDRYVTSVYYNTASAVDVYSYLINPGGTVTLIQRLDFAIERTLL